jgi:hypothetical protein
VLCPPPHCSPSHPFTTHRPHIPHPFQAAPLPSAAPSDYACPMCGQAQARSLQLINAHYSAPPCGPVDPMVLQVSDEAATTYTCGQSTCSVRYKQNVAPWTQPGTCSPEVHTHTQPKHRHPHQHRLATGRPCRCRPSSSAPSRRTSARRSASSGRGACVGACVCACASWRVLGRGLPTMRSMHLCRHICRTTRASA